MFENIDFYGKNSRARGLVTVEVLGRVIRVSLVDNVRFKEKLEGNEDLSQMATWMETIPVRWEYSSHGLTAGAVPGAAQTGVAGVE